MTDLITELHSLAQRMAAAGEIDEPVTVSLAAEEIERLQQQNDYLSALASGQPLYGLEEKIADLMQRNKALREELDQLKAETKRLDAAVGEEISNRDRVEAHADRLADGIAKALGVDIGEHSSANCPWNNAFFAIDELNLAAHDAEVIKNAGDHLHKMGLINSNAHLMLKHHANQMLCASNQAKEA